MVLPFPSLNGCIALNSQCMTESLSAISFLEFFCVGKFFLIIFSNSLSAFGICDEAAKRIPSFEISTVLVFPAQE